MGNVKTPKRTQLAESDLWYVIGSIPHEVDLILKQNPGRLYIAGGFIRALLNEDEPEVKDIDIFGDDVDVVNQAAKDVARMLGRKAYIGTTPCTTTIKHEDLPYPVQFVNNVAYESPQVCIDQIDFTVCQVAVWYEDDEYHSVCAEDFYHDLAEKRLVYTHPVRNEAPGGSLWRAFKLAQRGYSITQPVLANLVVRLNKGVQERRATRPKIISRLDALLCEPQELEEEAEQYNDHPEIEPEAILRSFRRTGDYF